MLKETIIRTRKRGINGRTPLTPSLGGLIQRTSRTGYAVLILAIGLTATSGPADAGSRGSRPRILLSTDVAIGLIDTHGGQSLAPIPYSATGPAVVGDPERNAQDIDDGLTLAMAINLHRARALNLLAIVPIFGNATLQPEMLVAHQITRNLKRLRNVPIVPGAQGPAGQVFHENPSWFDGSKVTILGKEGSFAASCENRGVAEMRKRLRRSQKKVTILAIGPATDVACLLATSRRAVTRKIAEVVWLASQLEGEALMINGKTVNDFNFRLDPLGGAILLAEASARDVPVRLMSFSLTGQTSQSEKLIAFNAEDFTGPEPPTPRSKQSLAWLLEAAEPRNAFWASIFGSVEGPFDQYALAATVWPELFDCRPAKAYILQCPYPVWSTEFDPATQVPYNAEDNPCVDHSGGNLAAVPAQLVVTLDSQEDGPLIRGVQGVDGGLPPLSTQAVDVNACIDFQSNREESRERFRELLETYTW
jgi:inosine-uridine nucleoside N-ribohydrolase